MADTRQAFDEAARSYDQWYSTPLGQVVDRIEKDLMLAAIALHPNEDALDLGAGTGQFSLHLARLGLKVTGVDISAGMLSNAEEKARAAGLPCRFLTADAGDLPFAPVTFDLVTCLTALEFFADPAAALKEAWRVLRPGGRIVAGVIHRDSPWGRLYLEAARAGDPIFSRARLLSVSDLALLLADAAPEIQQGLYLTPQDNPASLEDGLHRDQAAKLEGADPGFLVARWQKPQAWETVRRLFDAATRDGGAAVLTMTVSNACAVPG